MPSPRLASAFRFGNVREARLEPDPADGLDGDFRRDFLIGHDGEAVVLGLDEPAHVAADVMSTGLCVLDW